MVPTTVTSACCSTSQATTTSPVVNITGISTNSASIASKTKFDCLPSIQQQYSQCGFSNSAVEIIMAAWRDSTKKQYYAHIKKWIEFCSTRNGDPVHPTIAMTLDFLTSLHEKVLSYSSINTARSALLSFCSLPQSELPFGQLPIVKRFMKGVFQLRPALPKHHSVWDVNIIFNFLRSQPSVENFTLPDLSKRLTLLLCLLSGQRCQTVKFLSIEYMDISETSYSFRIMDKLKHTRPDFFDRKHRYSIGCQGICDGTLKFLSMSAGFPGSVHDSRILRNTWVFREAINKQILTGPIFYINNETPIKPYLVGDAAYPQADWLIKPFSYEKDMRPRQKTFNLALSQARVSIERAFGVLKGRWRLLLGKLELEPSYASDVAIACTVLHNICQQFNEPIDDVIEPYVLQQSASRETNRSADRIRQMLVSYVDEQLQNESID